NRRDLDDFAALISPAATPFLAQMANQAQRLTRQRFGHALQFYIPLYLSNLCANDCSYCGFSMSNALKRRTLTLAEVEQECQAIKAQGFATVLLVAGEHEKKVGLSYFKQVLPLVKRYFSYVLLEVQPLASRDYAELRQYGLDGVLVYQETYDRRCYAKHHIKGKKMDFDWRLATPERLGQAGVDKIGLGALLGLGDWRLDSLYLALHLRYLQQHYWRSRYSMSFPRLRPCAGGLADQVLQQHQSDTLISDKQLVQLICAWRLFDPELELSLSTRESAHFRDHVVPLAITSISAGSRTAPGAYTDVTASLEQFSTDDQRSARQVAASMASRGLQPVWKDWEAGLCRG
ncbi:MAG: 2-iminoacetate synthase ThiH, partial [Alishewanella sp. 32-51-5]